MSFALIFLVLAAFASALTAGLFYAYHWSVMPGLNAIDPLAAVNAMKSINVVIINPIFAFSFFGTLVFGGIAALLHVTALRTAPGLLVWAAFLVYALGTFGVTVMFNVPLNNQLAATSPTAANAAEFWRTFYEPWMFWNLVRTIASMFALVLFGAALWFTAIGRA